MTDSDLRIIKGQQTKEKILSSALLLIAEHGVPALSAKKIADDAGISKSNVFHHFHTVDDIVLELFGRICDEIVEPLQAEEYETMETFLDALGRATLELSKTQLVSLKAMYGFYNITLYNDEYRDKLLELKSQLITKLSKTICKIVSGDISPALADQLSEMLIVILDGYGLHYLLESDSKKYMAIWKLQSKMICDYIK